MPWQSSIPERTADLERLLHDLERRLQRLSRTAAHTTAAPPRSADRVSEAIATALSDIADRFRGRTHSIRRDAAHFGDDALRAGNDALRKITHEIEVRPLLTLALAVGVGVVAAGLLARRN